MPSEGSFHATVDPVHAGSDDLTRWPPSLVERRYALDILAGVDASRDLYTVAQSTDRAIAVLTFEAAARALGVAG